MLSDVAWEEYEHEETKKLVREALRLQVGGWPEGGSYYEDKERSSTGLLRLNEKGFSFLREKIRAEKKARREAWKDWATVIGGLATVLTGLGGVLIGILSIVCS